MNMFELLDLALKLHVVFIGAGVAVLIEADVIDFVQGQQA